MYHFATMFWPSGLIDGQSIRIDVVEDRLDLRVVGVREQVVGELQRVLAAGDLGRVQPAVDVHERPALERQPVRLGVGQPLRMREPLGDRPVFLDVGQVLGARHQREVVRAARTRCGPTSTSVSRSLAASSFLK